MKLSQVLRLQILGDIRWTLQEVFIVWLAPYGIDLIATEVLDL